MPATTKRSNRRATKATQRPLRPSRPSLDMKLFEPMTPIATEKIKELISRGAAVAGVTRTVVTLHRMGQTATIDLYGRVEWAAPR